MLQSPFGDDLVISKLEVLFNKLEHLLRVFFSKLFLHFEQYFAFSSHLKAFVLFLFLWFFNVGFRFVLLSLLNFDFLFFFSVLFSSSSFLLFLFRGQFNFFGVSLISKLFSFEFEFFERLFIKLDQSILSHKRENFSEFHIWMVSYNLIKVSCRFLQEKWESFLDFLSSDRGWLSFNIIHKSICFDTIAHSFIYGFENEAFNVLAGLIDFVKNHDSLSYKLLFGKFFSGFSFFLRSFRSFNQIDISLFVWSVFFGTVSKLVVLWFVLETQLVNW